MNKLVVVEEVVVEVVVYTLVLVLDRFSCSDEDKLGVVVELVELAYLVVLVVLVVLAFLGLLVLLVVRVDPVDLDILDLLGVPLVLELLVVQDKLVVVGEVGEVAYMVGLVRLED